MRTALVFLIVVALLGLAIPFAVSGQSGRNRPRNDNSNGSRTDDGTTKPITSENKPITSVPEAEDPKNVPLSSSDPGDVVNLSSTLVSVPLTVSDRSGRFRPGLSKKDFEVYEDGIKQQVAFFNSDEVPFHVVLLIDTSGSTTDSGREIKTAAEGFVGQLHDDDQVMVISFASRVNVETSFTSDRQELSSAIERIRWGGSTKLYDAVYQSVVNDLKNIKGRKALVLLTDGDDTSSHQYTYHQAIDAAVESGALIYVARYPGDEGSSQWPGRRGRWPGGGNGGNGGSYPGRRNPWPPWPFQEFNISPMYSVPQGPSHPGNGGQTGGTYRREGDFLTDLVQETGGDMFNATRFSDMSSLLRTVADELRHVYVIGFYSSNSKQDGRFRKVNIRVIGDVNVVVKYKGGYNAPKQQFATAP